MPDSVVGLFRSRSEAENGLRKLKEAGFGDDQVSVATPRTGRRGHYGMKVAAGIGAGIVLGVLVGAFAAGMVPGVHALMPGPKVATFLLAAVAGAATGAVAGALLSMAASGDTALYYEEEVQSGRVLVSVSGPRLDEARVAMLAAGAMEAAPFEAPLDQGRPRAEGG